MAKAFSARLFSYFYIKQLMKMKKVISLLFILMLSLTSIAGNTNKLYRSSLTEKGTLYFFYAQKMPKNKDSKALKPLSFDVTYLSGSDTVSIKATVLSLNAYNQPSVTIIKADGQKVENATEVIFRDLKKKGYINRIEIKMPRSEYRELYNADKPFTIIFGEQNCFKFADSQWQKHREAVNKVWSIIDLNP
jgi:hypothetical protein